MAAKKTAIAKKSAKPLVKFKNFYLKIRSRHPSVEPLRRAILTPIKILYRHGSTTQLKDGRFDVEINSTQAIRVSASKRLMKEAFAAKQVKTAVWWPSYADMDRGEIPFPIVAKNIFGSRGMGNYLLKTRADLDRWMVGKNMDNYIFEKFYNYNREYRLHVTKDGCFYTCRKMLKEGTPEGSRWYRNDSNSVWILETNPNFCKPRNWKAIEAECVKALLATGLDVGACDVRVQSSTTTKGKERETEDFIVLEINSAPSMGDLTIVKYANELPKIASSKYDSKSK